MLYRWRKALFPLLLTTTSTTRTLAFRQPSHSPHRSSSRHLRHSSSSLLTRAMSSSTTTTTTTTNTEMIPGRPTWQQTMLRIRDPQKSIPFYERLGFTLIDTMDFPQYKFSIYFLTTLPKDGPPYDLTPGTQAAHDYLWTMEGVALELTHNHGTEQSDDGDDDAFAGYHTGNQDRDGFGHVAVNVDDVYATADKLEAAGCIFQKKPDDGRMKGSCALSSSSSSFAVLS